MQAVTFGLWALALLSLLRAHAPPRRRPAGERWRSALATRTAPSFLLFPAFAAALLVCTQPGAWRVSSPPAYAPWRSVSLARTARATPARRAAVDAEPDERRRRGFRRPGADGCETLVFLKPRDHPVVLPSSSCSSARRGRRCAGPGWLVWVIAYLRLLLDVPALDRRQPAVSSALADPPHEPGRPDRTPARRRCGCILWRARPTRRRRRRCRAPGGLSAVARRRELARLHR